MNKWLVIALVFLSCYTVFNWVKIDRSEYNYKTMINKTDSLKKVIDNYSDSINELHPVLDSALKKLKEIPEKTTRHIVDSASYNNVIDIAKERDKALNQSTTLVRYQMNKIQSLEAVVVTTEEIVKLKTRELKEEIKSQRKGKLKTFIAGLGVGGIIVLIILL